MPTRDELVKAWGDHLLAGLSPKAKARYGPARFVGVEGDVAVMALPNPIHKNRCEELRADVEAALSKHFGTRVRLRLDVDASVDQPQAGADDGPSASDRIPQAHELEDAPAEDSVPDKLKKLFPGAEEV